MINKIGLVVLRIIFIYFLGLNAAAFGAQVAAGDNAPRGARDGVLNVADMLVMERFILGLETPTAEEFKVADIAPIGAPDGILNVADLLVLQRAVLGLVTLTPVNLGPDAPVLNSIASSTTANPFVISGTAAPNTTIRLYVNNQLQISTTSTASGSFTFEAALYDGSNTIYATTFDNVEESGPSNLLNINYTNTISRTSFAGISTNAVWTPGVPNAPYLITGNLSIGAGATLTIMPGTVLQFSAVGAYLTTSASGNLIVRGTAASKVVFTHVTHTKGAWNGITIGNGSSIDNAYIEYAYAGVTASGGTVTNSILRNNSYGIKVEKGAPQIGPGNVITANSVGVLTGRQFFITIDPPPSPNPVVTGNQIYNNTDKNYRANYFNDASTAVLNATNNWWGTTSPGAIDNTTVSYTNTTVSSCLINPPYTCYNTSPRIDFGGYLDGPGGAPVNANHFFHIIPPNTTLVPNTTYELINQVVVPQGVTLAVPEGVTFDARSTSSRLNIQGSLVVEGTSSSPVRFTSTQPQTTSYRWRGVDVSNTGTALINHAIFEYAQTGVGFTGTVEDSGNCQTQCVLNSQFINNMTGIGLGNTVSILNNTFQNNSSYGITASSGSAQIKANTFQNNGRGIYLLNSASPIINGGNILTANPYGIYVETSAGDSQPVINNNRIYANTTYNYYARSPSSKVLNARNNWWGSNSLEIIASKIYDYKDYAYSPVVDFSGYLQSAGGSPTIENNLVAITTDTTLYSNQTYKVISSLRVAPGITLTVQPGAILLFPRNAKLQVEGALVVEQGAAPAIFTTATHTIGQWKGIEISATAIRVMIEGAIIQYADKGVYFNGATQQDLDCTVFCVRNSVLSYNRYGVYMIGAAKPYLTGNRIVNNNTWGIYLQGAGSDATNPNPIIINNDIYGNTASGHGLYIYNYGAGTTLHINATANWWGRNPPTQGFGTTGSSDILISSTSIPAGVVDYSNAATQVLYPAISLPVVTLSTSATAFEAPASITLNATATVSNGAISVVDFYYGTTWIGSSTHGVSNVYSFTWNNVQPGTYTLKAIATSTYGASTSTTNRIVNVTGDVPPSISMASPVTNAIYYAPAMVPLSASINTTNSQRTITRVSYYNGASLIGETTQASYGYTWTNVPAGAYSLHAVLTDNTGATTNSARISISVNPITLTVDSSINNAVVNDDNMLVSGTFVAPQNTGVTVNNQLATIFKNTDGTYSYYANNVPLILGNNTITVTLASQDGQTVTTSISVTSTGSPGFSIRADRVFDVLPNGFIEFEYQNTSGLAASGIQVDSNNDGIFDPPIPAGPFSMNFSNYSTVRKWPVAIRVIDANSNVLYTTTQVIIISTETQQDAFVKPVITGMFNLLKQGNKTAAMQTLSSQARNTYGGVFDALMPYMATVSGELSNVEAVSNGSDIASHAILRAEGGVNKVYIINSIKDKDGVWRIDSM